MPHEFHTQRRIEFADTDMAGIVHFARFFVFMETAEHEFLHSLGTSVAAKLDNMQLGWPRLAASCEYLSPAKFEEILDIRVSVARKGNKPMTYQFEFPRGGVLIARGQMSSVCCLVGALGAFCVLLAFGAKGTPSVVMSIVFAGAPIVNAIVALALHPPAGGWSALRWQFIAGILLAALGGYLVTLYRPGS